MNPKALYLQHPKKELIFITDEPMTVLQVHRKLQGWADDVTCSSDAELDITDTDPSTRFGDHTIMIRPPYRLMGNLNLLRKGLIYSGGEVLYNKIVVQELIDDFKHQCLEIERRIDAEKLFWERERDKPEKKSGIFWWW